MYRKQQREQREFEDFHLSFGGLLSSDNRWVRLAKLIPWDQIEVRYASVFRGADTRESVSAVLPGVHLVQ